jgi:hypothetical protein
MAEHALTITTTATRQAIFISTFNSLFEMAVETTDVRRLLKNLAAALAEISQNTPVIILTKSIYGEHMGNYSNEKS